MIVNDLTSKYNSIIWDWNGTLLNDMWLCIDVVNNILKNRNSEQLDLSSYKNVFGFPITAYYKRIGIDFERESFADLAKVFISGYEGGVGNCKLQPAALDLLSIMKQNVKNQYMLTASHIDSVMKLLDFHSITQYFNDIKGLDNHHAESKVEIGMRLIEENMIDNKTALLIGDTLHDYYVAKEIGVDCILVSNGHQSRERLIKGSNNQVVVLNSIEELFD